MVTIIIIILLSRSVVELFNILLTRVYEFCIPHAPLQKYHPLGGYYNIIIIDPRFYYSSPAAGADRRHSHISAGTARESAKRCLRFSERFGGVYTSNFTK